MFPYKGIEKKLDTFYKGVLIEGTGMWVGYVVKILYVEGEFSGQVRAGQRLGTAQNLKFIYPNITNHIHIGVEKGGTFINPLELWQKTF